MLISQNIPEVLFRFAKVGEDKVPIKKLVIRIRHNNTANDFGLHTTEHNQTFAQAIRGGKKKPLFTHVEFNREVGDYSRFENAFMGVVENT